MNSISLRNRWEIFRIQEDEEETQDSEIISNTEQEAKVITIAADHQKGGTWLVDKGRRRSRRRRKICLLDTLPADVMSQIMEKVGAMEIMDLLQQGLCSSWRNLTYEPSVYRRIDLRNHIRSPKSSELFRKAMKVVDLSKGQLEEFSIADYPGKELLNYVLHNSLADSIKILRFVKCQELTDDLLLEFARKFSCLEELELSYCEISLDVLAEVGRMCSKLTCFRLVVIDNQDFYYDAPYLIAKTMPKLLRLQLGNFGIHAKELQAILDGCPYLVYLDTRRCSIYIQQDEQKIFEGRIQCLRLYNEPAGDYPEDYILNYCQDICRLCCCSNETCRRSYIFEYDPLKDLEYVVEADDVLENKVFLPAKATACYL